MTALTWLHIIIASEITLGALSLMQHLCRYAVKNVYTQIFFREGENSTKHGRAGAVIFCYTAVVIHPMTYSPAVMQDWVLPSGIFCVELYILYICPENYTAQNLKKLQCSIPVLQLDVE
jgi:hypothetical protein